MAISEQNLITHGLHGRIGNLVFRRWGNKCVVSAAPASVNRKWSRAQSENRMVIRVTDSPGNVTQTFRVVHRN